jgi:stearoyl-CoA desaturase (delta-9 desaturase)
MRIFDKINSDTKVKILQASVHVILLATLFTAWSIQLFVIGLVLGWFFWLTGVHGSLHKYSSHRSFTAKNKAIEVFILFMGTIIGLGSNLSWAATHRKHHQHSDQEGDPHSIHTDGGGFWRAVKIYFYYFPTYLINPRTVKDLTSDPLHKWFHKHYYKVIFSYVVILALVDPVYVGYFWALPVFYVYTGISYITVFAHNITLHKAIGYKNYVTTDQTYNWTVASLLLPGEGNHNNHHALPGAAKNKMTERDIDTGYWYLKLIGNVPEHQTYHQNFIT